MLYTTINESEQASKDRELIGRLQNWALQYGEFKLTFVGPVAIQFSKQFPEALTTNEQDMALALRRRWPNVVSVLVGAGGLVANLGGK